MMARREEHRVHRWCRTTAAVVAVMLGVPMGMQPGTAWAEEPVTYEVVSADIAHANIEFQDTTGRISIPAARLPWRMDTTVTSVRGAPPQGSQVRADWRPSAAPNRWVSVRILVGDKLLCQSTLDVGNATCYGITPSTT